MPPVKYFLSTEQKFEGVEGFSKLLFVNCILDALEFADKNNFKFFPFLTENTNSSVDKLFILFIRPFNIFSSNSFTIFLMKKPSNAIFILLLF